MLVNLRMDPCDYLWVNLKLHEAGGEITGEVSKSPIYFHCNCTLFASCGSSGPVNK